jgi:uncharacterized protein YndB with AHSA1/START domain
VTLDHPRIARLTRILPAPPEEVWDAWTDPSLMARWMTPIGVAEAVVDLRVGGRFTVVMRGEGRVIEHHGEYLALQRPARLVFTWRSPYTGPGSSRVTVALAPDGQGTRLELTHEGLPDDAVESHGGGWRLMLERLAAELGH